MPAPLTPDPHRRQFLFSSLRWTAASCLTAGLVLPGCDQRRSPTSDPEPAAPLHPTTAPTTQPATRPASTPAPAAATVPLGLLVHEIYKKHVTGPYHPESPARIKALIDAFAQIEDTDAITRLAPRPAREDRLALAHDQDYLDLAKRQIEAGQRSLSTGDTNVCADSWEVARHAVGGVFHAVDQVMKEKVRRAFCAVRPPGHHATFDRGMGFCVVNNIALAARYAQKHHDIGKVLIVDWDIHHGNGTQDIFYDDPSVFFLSTHQDRLYPRDSGMADETGEGKGKGFTLNRPFPANSGRKEVLPVYADQLREAMATFKAELVLVSAGFDSRIDDPLGSFTLTDDDFADLTRAMMAIAEEHADGRLVSVLEGGYNIEGLAAATTTHAKTLAEGLTS